MVNNKKACNLLILILVLCLNQYLVRGAPIQPVERFVGKLHISIDPRMELLSTVQLLSNYPVVNRKLPYSKEILQYFESFPSQKAVTMTDSLTQKYGFGFEAPVIFMLYLSQLPELEPQILLPDYLMARDYLMSQSGQGDNLEQYREAIKQFAKTSDFETFWNSKTLFYNDVLDMTIAEIGKNDFVKQLEDYYNETQESYNIIIAPSFKGGYGPKIAGNDGKDNVYACLQTTNMKGNIPYLNEERLCFFVWHEFGHSFVNPVTEKYADRVAACGKMFDPIKQGMKRQAYGDWETCVNEHIVRAVHVRLAEQYLGSKQSKKILNRELRNNFIYIEPLVEKLKDFEIQRDESNITFSEFYPELLNTFDSLLETEYWKQVNITSEFCAILLNIFDNLGIGFRVNLNTEAKLLLIVIVAIIAGIIYMFKRKRK